jgi:uncharacterized protein
MVRVWVAALAALMVIGSAAAALAGDAEECKNTKIGADRSAVAAACTRLAEKGEGWAQCYLGFLYAVGHGVPQDDKAAAEWYRKAAEQGVALCQLLVGLEYAKGGAVPQDDVQAYMWFELAAAAFPQGSKDPQERSNHDQAVKNRDIAAGRMTQAQIEEAQRLAREWKPKTKP